MKENEGDNETLDYDDDDCDYDDCYNCGGKGGFDSDDLMCEDPLWYDMNSYEVCPICKGKGYI